MSLVWISILSILTGVLSWGAVKSTCPQRQMFFLMGSGFSTALFFLALGFEGLFLLHLFLVIAGTATLWIFRSLFGDSDIQSGESSQTMKTLILPALSSVALAALFYLGVGTNRWPKPATERVNEQFEGRLGINDFTTKTLESFPEVFIALGVLLFVLGLLWATLSRPDWKKGGKA